MLGICLRLAGARYFVALGLMIPASGARAQRSAKSDEPVNVSWGAIDGSVRNTSGSWMRGVEVVSVDNSLIRTKSGAAGSFRIDSISAGPHLIRFRRIGLLPVSVPVVVDPNSIVSIDVALQPFPITLSRVNVQAASGEVVRLPAGVADRIRTGIGTYITGDQIAREKPIETVEIFRRVPGLSVDGPPGREVVYNTRGAQTINGTGCPAGMAVVVDGVPLNGAVTSAGGADPLGVTTNSGALNALRSIPPRDIAAIEIYKDGVEAPASLISSPCGTIYIWTRNG